MELSETSGATSNARKRKAIVEIANELGNNKKYQYGCTHFLFRCMWTTRTLLNKLQIPDLETTQVH